MIRGFKIYHIVDPADTAFLKHAIKRLSLRHRPWEPVQDKPIGSIRMGKPVANDANNDFIGNEFACLHITLRLAAERRATFNRVSQNLPGGDLRDAFLCSQALRLGALTDAGCSEKDKTHR